MNIKQLEKLRTEIEIMRIALEEDREGISNIEVALDDFEKEVIEELKSLIWLRYLESGKR